jgi:hypothetical protein
MGQLFYSTNLTLRKIGAIIISFILIVSALLAVQPRAAYADVAAPGSQIQVEIYLLPGATLASRFTAQKTIIVSDSNELVASTVSAELSQNAIDAGWDNLKLNAYNAPQKWFSIEMRFGEQIYITERTLLCTITVELREDASMGEYALSPSPSSAGSLFGYYEVVPGSVTVGTSSSVGLPGSGDLDGSGVTTSGALQVARAVISGATDWSEAKIDAADIDRDGVLTMSDVIRILRLAAGLT